MKIPSENRWTQSNDGDITGVLHETHNCDLSKAGTIRLNRKSVAHEKEATNFEQVFAIDQLSGVTYVVTDSEVFSGNLDGSQLTQVTSSPGLDNTTDAIVWRDKLHVIDGTTVDTYNGSSWTSDVITGLNSASAHPMAIFESLTTHQLAIGDVNVVRVYDSSYSAGTALTLLFETFVTSLAYRNGYLYVATKNEYGNEAYVFMWNGDSGNADYAIPVGGSWIYCIVPYGNSVAGITNEGELFTISGSQKVTLGFLPLFVEEGARWYSGASTNVGQVSMNGMTVVGDSIYIVVEGRISNSGYVDGMKDGVWCYDPSVGLYHYATPTTDEVTTDTSLTRSGNELTTSANHNLKTGDAVQFISIGNLTGVSADKIYYAVVVDANTISLAASRYDADNGNVYTLGGTPNSSDKLTYVPNTDYGTVLDGNMGAIRNTGHRTTVKPLYAADIVYGAEPNNTSKTQQSTFQSFVDAWNVGWFSTQKVFTNALEHTWKEVTVFLKGSLCSNEVVIVKYLSEDRASLPTQNVACTWSDGDTFTTTDLQINDGVVEVGDEIMIVNGRGQGRLAHITAIAESAGTVTVSIDETLGSASDTCDVVVTGYKKAGTVTGNNRPQKGYVTFKLPSVKSPWVQIKVEMRGFQIEVPLIELSNGVSRSGV